jgi:NAD(P)-dependent dehydrogenase (short-subunit alcohol dehydrogenase family)
MAKTWLITRSSRGFGLVWAAAALRRGDRVAATARDADVVQGLVDEFGDAVLPIALDMTDRATVFETVARAHAEIVDAPQPPLRFFLGDVAMQIAEEAHEGRLAQWREWQSVAATAQGRAQPA